MKISLWLVLGLTANGLAAPIAHVPGSSLTSLTPPVRDTRWPFRIVRFERPYDVTHIHQNLKAGSDGDSSREVGHEDDQNQSSRDVRIHDADPQLPVPVFSSDPTKTLIVDADGHPETLNSGERFIPVWDSIRNPRTCLYSVLASTTILAFLFMLLSLLLLLAAFLIPDRYVPAPVQPPPDLLIICRVRSSPRAAVADPWSGQQFSEKDQLRHGHELTQGHMVPAVGDYDDPLVVFYDDMI